MGDTFYGFYFDLWCAAVLTIAWVIWTCWLMPVSNKYRETVIIVLIYLSVVKTLLMRIINHQRTKNLTLQNFPIRINQASWKLFLHYKDAFKTLIFIFISFIYWLSRFIYMGSMKLMWTCGQLTTTTQWAKTRPQHRELRALLFSISVWVL